MAAVSSAFISRKPVGERARRADFRAGHSPGRSVGSACMAYNRGIDVPYGYRLYQ
jgi:hypothetical protein